MSRHEPDDPKLVELAKAFKPGLYIHYRGDAYRALFIAWESTNAQPREPKVVYASLSEAEGYGINVRSLKEWNELVEWHDGKMRPRFDQVAG